ncbi:hypothetical protein PIB30_093616, partial [Stylosanthes scabra]|nr:hypothetical protein [Stylosanthes scabra]
FDGEQQFYGKLAEFYNNGVSYRFIEQSTECYYNYKYARWIVMSICCYCLSNLRSLHREFHSDNFLCSRLYHGK